MVGLAVLVGLDDLRGLFQSKLFSDSVILIHDSDLRQLVSRKGHCSMSEHKTGRSGMG